jgi:hypothetical protein
MPSAADAGNVVHITGGSHFVPGWYQIIAAGAAWTLDRNATDGSAASGMTGRMGGAFANLSQAFSMWLADAGGVPDMAIYLRYSATPYIWSTPVSTASFPATASAHQNRLVGYYSTHDDAPTGPNRPVIGAGGAIVLFNQGVNSGWIWENAIFDGNNIGLGALVTSSGFSRVYNCKFLRWTGLLFNQTGGLGSELTGNEFTANSGSTGMVNQNGPALTAYNWAHDNTQTGYLFQGTVVTYLANLITNNMGANTDAITCARNCAIVGNTIYRTGRDGVVTQSPHQSATVNNLIACGRYAIRQNANGGGAVPWPGALSTTHHNAFWSNTANYETSYVTRGDVTLGGSGCSGNGPFTAPATTGAGDWSLNSDVALGGRVRAAGVPGELPGLTTRGYLDIGALQHADAQGTVPTAAQTAHPFAQ